MEAMLAVCIILVALSVVWVGMQLRGIRQEMQRKESG